MNKLETLINICGDANKTAKVLGVSSSSVSEWRSGKRDIPKYMELFINVLVNVPMARLDRIIEEATR